MILLEHSTFDGSTIGRSLGLPEYSYWFVRKAFRPILERFGVVVPTSGAPEEVDRIHRAARAHGQDCAFLSFNPPHHAPLGLACPVVPVFAWEFDTIPDESWDDDPRNDWRVALSRAPAAITHSRFSVQAVRRSLGEDFPIWSIPAPVADRAPGSASTARGWRAPFRLDLRSGIVLDSRSVDLALFRPGRDFVSLETIRELQRTAARPGPPPPPLTLEGVVYTSVLNPADGRKNWGDLVAGFVYAFRDEPRAALVLKISHRDIVEGVVPILQDLAKLGRFRCRVLVVHGMLDEADYAALVEATSYAVNTSQGEGQCLPLMEFMAAGRPAVAPRHTAMAEYVTPDDAFVVSDHLRPAFWPHDPRQAHTCMRHQVEFDSLVRAYRESFAVARDAPERYARMSRAAVAALRAYCSDEVAAAALGEVIGRLRSAPADADLQPRRASHAR